MHRTGLWVIGICSPLECVLDAQRARADGGDGTVVLTPRKHGHVIRGGVAPTENAGTPNLTSADECAVEGEMRVGRSARSAGEAKARADAAALEFIALSERS